MSELYLVTGGAGFIGSNIAEALVNSGKNVRIIDNLSTGHIENISDFSAQVDFIQGDIRYLNTVMEVMDGVDYVLHQAALPSVPRSIQTPIESNDNNLNGTLNILYAAAKSGVKRVVYAASSSAYGDAEQLPKVEDMAPKPLSPYAVNKLAGELYCSVYSRVFDLETVALRYFNVFGPRQDPNSYYSAVIPKFIKALLEGKPPVIYGDGDQSRDFSYIDNVVSANLLACKAPDASGHMMNLACGERTSLNTLYRMLQEILGVNIPAEYTDPRPGDVKHSLADIEKAKSLLGYKVLVPVKDGLVKTVDWFRSYFS
jgi:nucleoside-diphosphate-sugar epimerase